MARRRIFVDKSELVLIVPSDGRTATYNLVSSHINRIAFEPCEEFLLGFIPQKSEKITIVASNTPDGVVYTRNTNKAYFDTYKEELRQFAKENRIPFTDDTQSTEQ